MTSYPGLDPAIQAALAAIAEGYATADQSTDPRLKKDLEALQGDTAAANRMLRTFRLLKRGADDVDDSIDLAFHYAEQPPGGEETTYTTTPSIVDAVPLRETSRETNRDGRSVETFLQEFAREIEQDPVENPIPDQLTGPPLRYNQKEAAPVNEAVERAFQAAVKMTPARQKDLMLRMQNAFLAAPPAVANRLPRILGPRGLIQEPINPPMMPASGDLPGGFVLVDLLNDLGIPQAVARRTPGTRSHVERLVERASSPKLKEISSALDEAFEVATNQRGAPGGGQEAFAEEVAQRILGESGIPGLTGPYQKPKTTTIKYTKKAYLSDTRRSDESPQTTRTHLPEMEISNDTETARALETGHDQFDRWMELNKQKSMYSSFESLPHGKTAEIDVAFKLAAAKYRPRVEVFIVDDKNRVLAGRHPEGNVIFPGGGVEEKEELLAAGKREALEEVGRRVSHLRKLTDPIRVAFSEVMKKDQGSEYAGSDTTYLVGRDAGRDTYLHGADDGWKMRARFRDIDKVIADLKKTEAKGHDYAAYDRAAIDVLKKLQRRLNVKRKSKNVRWHRRGRGVVETTIPTRRKSGEIKAGRVTLSSRFASLMLHERKNLPISSPCQVGVSDAKP
jgi:8-oxo-dGTP pyrophosphatase MutT (NUDIX family)